MKELHVGDSVRVGSHSEEVRGTVVDLDRRPGYGRLIIDSDELAEKPRAVGKMPELAAPYGPSEHVGDAYALFADPAFHTLRKAGGY